MNQVTVSVVTNTLNQGRFLEQTIQSLLAQEGDFLIDYVIVDGGSTDNTLEVIQDYARRLAAEEKPPRTADRAGVLAGEKAAVDKLSRAAGFSLRWISEPDEGRAQALNKGFRLARGSILTWLAGDDLLAHSHALARIVDYWADHPETKLLYASRKRIDPQGNTILESEEIAQWRTEDIREVGFLVMPGTFWHRSLWESVGELNEQLEFVYAWDYWVRCSERTQFRYLDEVIGVKRIYLESASANPLNRLRRSLEIIRFLLDKGSLTDRSLLYYAISPHPWVIGKIEVLRRQEQLIRSLLRERPQLDSPLRFGERGNAQYFQTSGWSEPEVGYCWTLGEQAHIEIPIGKTAAAELTLHARLFSFLVPGKLDRRLVRVMVNDHPAGEWAVDRPNYQDRYLRMPRAWWEGSELIRISFQVSDAPSPEELGLSADRRRIGIAFTALRLLEPKSPSAEPGLPPAVFHITHQKAGSQWILAVLRDLSGDRFMENDPEPQYAENRFFQEFALEGKVYPTLYLDRSEFESIDIPANSRRFIVIRDLRGTLVSYYFSVKFSHPLSESAAWMAELRERIRSLSAEQGMIHMIEQGYLDRFASIQLSWLETADLLVRYEDLFNNPMRWFEAIARHCALPVSQERLAEIIDRHSFVRVSGGREPGQVNPSHHLRSGKPGLWRNHFTPRVISSFKSKFGDLLIATGYEKDKDWRKRPAANRPVPAH